MWMTIYLRMKKKPLNSVNANVLREHKVFLLGTTYCGIRYIRGYNCCSFDDLPIIRLFSSRKKGYPAWLLVLFCGGLNCCRFSIVPLWNVSAVSPLSVLMVLIIYIALMLVCFNFSSL
jgi:hypothetical protein